MTKLSRCVCCNGPLEPAQQLRFLVETDNLDNSAYLARIRALPSANGKPLPVCKACQTQLQSHPTVVKIRKTPAPLVLVGLGALSVGMLLGVLFAPRN